MGWFIVVVVLQNVVWPRDWGPVCPPPWGHIFNSLHLGLGFYKLCWWNSNSGRRPHYLHSFTNTPYATISLRRSNWHPWKWACRDRWSVDHPWMWDSLAGIGVSLEAVSLLFCLYHCCFCHCYLREQLAELF